MIIGFRGVVGYLESLRQNMEFRVELPKSQESCDANGIPPANLAD